MKNNVVWHNGHVARSDRNRLNGHDSGVIWLTGLSAAGKSTIARQVERALHEKGIRSYVLDGDNIRHGLNVDLGFSYEQRKENIRRIVEVAKLFVDSGIIVIAAFITPFSEERAYIRNSLEGLDYVEVYVKCDISECVSRDPKGQYKKALNGLIKDYTGISSPYEEPENPDIVIDTQAVTVEQATQMVLDGMKHLCKERK